MNLVDEINLIQGEMASLFRTNQRAGTSDRMAEVLRRIEFVEQIRN